MPKVIRRTSSGAIQVSPHFHLSEFTDSDTAEREGIDNTPNPMSIQNLFLLAAMMEKVRTLLGNKTIIVSSGYRSVALNTRVGGAKNSEHMTGSACDFRCPSFGTPLQVATAISKSTVKFGQLIFESSWVHLSLPDGVNDGEVLTARFQNGKATYVQGL